MSVQTDNDVSQILQNLHITDLIDLIENIIQ